MKVKEIIFDKAANRELICKCCFPQERRLTDRFYVQQLATKVLIRDVEQIPIEALDAENDCNTILKSEAAKITDWLNWSEVAFIF